MPLLVFGMIIVAYLLSQRTGKVRFYNHRKPGWRGIPGFGEGSGRGRHRSAFLSLRFFLTGTSGRSRRREDARLAALASCTKVGWSLLLRESQPFNLPPAPFHKTNFDRPRARRQAQRSILRAIYFSSRLYTHT